MWIETENNQLVNTANVDTIFISNINEQYFLIAQKNFSDFQVAEYVLAEGSRQRIETQYNRVMDAIRSGDHFVKIYSSKKNDHKGGFVRITELAQPSGHFEDLGGSYDPEQPGQLPERDNPIPPVESLHWDDPGHKF